MTHEKTRFISYLCPKCRQSVIVEKDVFALAAAPARIQCPCGQSELTIEFMPQRVSLRVPCVACGREHFVSCPTHAFLRERPWPSPAPPPAWTAAMWGRRARCTPPPPGWSGRWTSWRPRTRPERRRRSPSWTPSSWRRFSPRSRTSPPGGASPAPAAPKTGPFSSITARWT